MTLRHRLWLLAGLLLSTPVWAAGDLAIGVGSEYFSWREYDDSGDRLLEESGPRLFMTVDAERRYGDWVYGFRGRIYSAQVDYDGQLLDGTPYKTDTDYNGLTLEFDFTHPITFNGDYSASAWAMRLGLGYDTWRRNILGSGGYEEHYTIPYLRLGMLYGRESALQVLAGVKYPFSTEEDVDWSRFGFDDPALSPEPDFSLFATLAYRMAKHWRLSLSYDSYRFKKSDEEVLRVDGVAVTSGGSPVTVFQPESQQDTFGLGLSYLF